MRVQLCHHIAATSIEALHANGVLEVIFAKKAAEHRFGKRKAKFLPIQYSAEAIESIKAVKRRLHTNGSLDRGTFFEQS